MNKILNGLNNGIKKLADEIPELKRREHELDDFFLAAGCKIGDLELELSIFENREEFMKNQLEHSAKVIFRLSLENLFMKRKAEEEEIEMDDEIRSVLFYS